MSVVCEMPAGYSVDGPLSQVAPMFSTITPYSATCPPQSGGKKKKSKKKYTKKMKKKKK